MSTIITNIVAALSMGAMFAFIFWILTNMREPVLFVAIAFVLGAFSETFRRWLVHVKGLEE